MGHLRRRCADRGHCCRGDEEEVSKRASRCEIRNEIGRLFMGACFSGPSYSFGNLWEGAVSQAASLLHVHLGQQARGAGIVVEDQPQSDMRVYMLNVMPPGLGPLGSG